MSSNPAKYEGSCLCGQVKVQVEGPPLQAAYCHCKTCRTWHAAPINALSIWPNEAVSVTQGEELIENYQSGISNRHWCRHCGSGLMNRLGNERTVVYAMVLAESGYIHEASYHINCDEAVLDLHDGIPKYMGWRDSETAEEPLQTQMRPSSKI
ncbi:MAG: GFA family protein [Candidatus Latescibacteria bacterium]|nr:GFA family protein [Candidatus Latescibacterota bacterium]